MAIFYFVVIALLFVILGLIAALVWQQYLFAKSREQLEQKLIARDLPEYVEQRMVQESPVEQPQEEEQEDIYTDIDQLSQDEAEEAVLQHFKENSK